MNVQEFEGAQKKEPLTVVEMGGGFCQGDKDGAPNLLGTPQRAGLEGQKHTQVAVRHRRGSFGSRGPGLTLPAWGQGAPL